MHAVNTLFIKPSNEATLYQAQSDLNSISFRTLLLQTDIDILFHWVNQPYTKQFWQLDGSKKLLFNTYQSMLNSSHAHSFIGCHDDRPVCQLDIYRIASDGLKEHIESKENDCGLHFLSQPPRQSVKGLSLLMLTHFLHYYFSFPQAERLFIEPDKTNGFANLLAKRAGFVFIREIKLSYKTANLYCITREDFEHHQKSLSTHNSPLTNN